jgi:Entner-Doudoroff aldolase
MTTDNEARAASAAHRSDAATNSAAASSLAVAQRLDAALAQLPIIAILRGLRSEEAIDVVECLYAAGIRVAEVPLNSPQPFVTIAALVAHFGDRMVLGGGTVTSVAQVRELAACGAALCVAPNTDADVIKAALAAGMLPMPGFQTPTEAFVAVAAGARHLKMFPAAGRSADLAALRTVLPADVQVAAVGGVNALNGAELAAAGAAAFGIGGDLYRPGMSAAAVGERARAMAPYFERAALGRRAVALCNPQAQIGESPLWQPVQARLLWTDPVTRRLLHARRDGSEAGEVALAASVFGIAALPDGAVVGTLAQSLCRIDADSGAIDAGPAAPLAAGSRFNDLAVDARGGLWAGAMHGGLLAGTGALYYAATVDHTPRVIATGLGVPNGMAFSADGATLYLIDTLARTLLAYAVDLDAGTLAEPTIVSDFMHIPGKPDGMTIAADGTLWVALWGGGCVVQLAPCGALLQLLRVPAPHVSSVCIDPAGTLFITTSRMRLGPRQLADAPGSGGLFAIDGATGA